MTIAAGIDVGTGTVKAALFRVGPDGKTEWLSRAIHRIRQRDPAIGVDAAAAVLGNAHRR